ncbi:JAB domain-containing protein [Xanthomonas euvesicatoria]|uniref:JAB domain-containing protein n=1 Tax=Xanthomonas euvesicatoria TaxID=456327 RepID=UPI003D2F574A
MLFLNVQHRLIDYVEMLHGTIDATDVYPREVVKQALRPNAAAVKAADVPRVGTHGIRHRATTDIADSGCRPKWA